MDEKADEITSYIVNGEVVCRHVYRVVTQNLTIRYCEICGQSWVLDMSYGAHWSDIREPGQEKS